MPSAVSIPQAVGTVATLQSLRASILLRLQVSIPQAVGTVATNEEGEVFRMTKEGFNTASGRYCCNKTVKICSVDEVTIVSIPQAVGTVATYLIH